MFESLCSKRKNRTMSGASRQEAEAPHQERGGHVGEGGPPEGAAETGVQTEAQPSQVSQDGGHDMQRGDQLDSSVGIGKTSTQRARNRSGSQGSGMVFRTSETLNQENTTFQKHRVNGRERGARDERFQGEWNSRHLRGAGGGRGRHEGGRQAQGDWERRDLRAERALPHSARWADAQHSAGHYQGRRQLSTIRDGLQQVNTYSIYLRNVRINGYNSQTRRQMKMYPSINKIHYFISTALGLDIKKIVSITNLRAKQQVWISFLEERDVIDLENRIFKGVVFPESGVKIEGRRLDNPIISVILTGAPFSVDEFQIKSLFERWGKVHSLDRGTSSISLQEGIKGITGSGWVWEGSWEVRIKVEEGVTLPSFVSADGGTWELRHDGSPTVCFICADPHHLAGNCQAPRRKERFISQWEEELGDNVEVFFPTKKTENMEESDFLDLRKKNIEKGNAYGQRKKTKPATNSDEFDYSKVSDSVGREEMGRIQARMITLENQIKVSERDLLKEVEDNKIRKRSSDKVLSEKNLQISEMKKQLDEGLQASKGQLEELRDDLKNVQSERLEAS